MVGNIIYCLFSSTKKILMCSLLHYEHTTLQFWLVFNCPTCYKHVIFPTNDILNPIEGVLLEGVLQLLNYSKAEN